MPVRTRKLSAREALEDLKRIQSGSKEPISSSLMRSRWSSLYKDLLRHFGSVEVARKVAGLPPPPPSRKFWTQEMVIAELKRLHNEGVRLTTWNMQKSGNGTVVDAANTYCGGLVHARLLAGLPEPRAERTSRKAFIYLIKRHTSATNREIAESLGTLTYSAVAKISESVSKQL